MLKISLYHDFCVALHVHISMCAKLNDTLAVGGAASLRNTIILFLNACSILQSKCAAGCGTSCNLLFIV